MKLFQFFKSIILSSQILNNDTLNTQINTVDINPYYYQGIWYQVYGDKFVLDTFERDAYCACANYTILSENKIDVYNWERKGSVDGPIEGIHGYALITDVPGQLDVYFYDKYPAPYWIINTGPIINEQYQYAIVTDPYMIGLYVLVRNITQYYELYDNEVIVFLNESGFNKSYNKPIRIIHEGCK